MEIKFKCTNCEQYWDKEELVTMYECSNCGTVFSKDNSADGMSHRCPDCNKFASKLHDMGCPECESEDECEETEVEQNAEGEWFEPEEKEAIPGEGKSHFHVQFTHKSGRVGDLNDDTGAYLTRERAELFMSGNAQFDHLEDGSYIRVYDPLPGFSGDPVVSAKIVECHDKHGKYFKFVK